MQEIRCEKITETVARLCIEANYYLGDDVLKALRQARDAEVSPVGREVLDQILENAAVARDEEMPLCQDTGLTAVFLDVGQDVHIVGGDFYEAIQEGVRRGYEEGYLRKSVVDKPFSARVNTRDNTPAVIHTQIVPGDRLKITVVPKGGGSENMSAALNLLDYLGITKSKANRLVTRLSGGEQQRVAIARALATNVEIILADEPTGNVDEDTESEIIAIFKKLAHEHDKCVIVVTHSPQIAAEADVVLTLQKGKFILNNE